MSRNWSLFLVVAFVLGFGTKTYLDSLDKPARRFKNSLVRTKRVVWRKQSTCQRL